MKKSILILALSLGALVACHRTNYTMLAPAWEPDYSINRFEREIEAFEAADAKSMPEKGGTVFTGSSSFRLWFNVQKDLNAPIINRGFGGSALPDVIHYLDRTVLKYEPRTIVVYCENDQFGNKYKSPEQTRDSYVELTRQVRQKLPKVQMYFVSLKPSPSRWSRRDEVMKTNQLIREFVESDRHHEYIDVWPVMMKDGRPDGSIFIKDSLHMNAEGYRRWTQVFKPIVGKP